MDEARFWSIVEESRTRAAQSPRAEAQEFLDLQIEQLRALLRQLPPTEVAAYQHAFSHHFEMAYHWELWGAAYWLGGGCSDDCFMDFRATLISLGRERFFQVLDDPDTLAEITDQPDVPYMLSEGFQYVAADVYRELTGGGDLPTEPVSWRDEPDGAPFDFDDEELMQQHYPRIVARYPEMDY